MIIFYNKSTHEIIGTIDGRVHSEQQLKMFIGDPKEVDKIIIGYTDVVTKKLKNGKLKSERKPYNLHLWNKYLEFENPANFKKIVNHKVNFDKEGKLIDFIPK